MAKQSQSSNKAIIGALKKRLEAAKGLWAEELPAVLWANRTTPKGQDSHPFRWCMVVKLSYQLKCITQGRRS